MTDDPHAMPTQDTEPLGIKVKLVVLIGALFVLLLVTILAGAQAGVRYAYEQKQEKRWLLPNPDLNRLEAEQYENINRYGVVNTERGVYSIPIDRAMELVAKRERRGE